MSDIPELVLSIDPGPGTSLRVSIQANGFAPITDEVVRDRPSFTPDDLAHLRSGSVSITAAEQLAHQVTSWLLDTDLRGHLGTAFNAAREPFRIVIQEHHTLLDSLAEVPFELIEFNDMPVVLRKTVRALVHTQRSRSLPVKEAPTRWPLHILLVRSNPPDLGGLVPPIMPIRDRIMAHARARDLGDAVKVTVLSSEPGGSGPATHDALLTLLRDHPREFSVLVYLGHGDLQALGPDELQQSGVLQFERSDAPFANPVDAETLRTELRNYPVPVVVLTGCLTAAGEAVMQHVPTWMRGIQNVASALVYGESGVQCCVGMRTRLETTDADRFLEGFFESLIVSTPGDVEHAVYRGRENLYAQRRYPPSWSAPVLFRTTTVEPVFEWLRRQPELIDEKAEVIQPYREQTWATLSDLSGVATEGFRKMLSQMESSIVASLMQHGAAVMWPLRIESKAGGLVHAEFMFQGALEVTTLKGRITFPTMLVARAARPTAALTAAGFSAYFKLDQEGVAGFILCSSGEEPASIPPGPILEIDLEVPAVAAVHRVAVDSLTSNPPSLLSGWNNAIVLSPARAR
ncbi:Hypothetical protein A7982_05380 [Minicystis rosea]|nr:Hypothetical protein A7982_05380 [Minicystis rosea]